MVKITIEPYGSLPCELAVFVINDIRADKSDFGENHDIDPGNAEEYACGDNTFCAKPPTRGVLNKYKITLSEYAEIVSELESALHVGSCGWCV